MKNDFFRYRGPGCDIQGYWPYRGDFDYEYDNELEYSIKDLEITGEEEEKDLHYKLCLLRIFNSIPSSSLFI